ncbi:Outer-membrane lipoprotein carrier protein [termite gut metagenome]|uniref:Outer-membrane lipoprotein carrier protein n=1 Tax=termite gut metagenome TaxID=433724 RepID=A0A5J4QD55_9ZZZZ
MGKRMKRILYLLVTILFALSLKAQTSQTESRKILDSASAAIRTGGGIKADFTVKVFGEDRLLEEMQGSIRLKEEKLLLKTDDAVIWFDGKTQWSYWAETEEVNVTNPTTEELQSINPYVLLSAYQNGFECQKGSKTQFQGKPVNEVLLTAIADNRQDVLRARLYILKETYQLVFIEMEQQGGNRSEITVTGYQTKKNYDDALFRFNKKEYPNAEIIDLR